MRDFLSVFCSSTDCIALLFPWQRCLVVFFSTVQAGNGPSDEQMDEGFLTLTGELQLHEGHTIAGEAW